MTHTDASAAYEDPAVVDYYARAEGLQPAEEIVLSKYFRAGMRVLDIGVGGGRTTPFLAPLASRYVGIDKSSAMVERCRQAFPDLLFECLDAAAPSVYGEGSFDFVLFSFNGLGYVPTDAERQVCLHECVRVLGTGGIFAFSLHNSKFLFPRPILSGIGLARAAWRLTYSAYQAVRNAPARLLAQAFWRGSGYLIDPLAHGGLRTYVSTPDTVMRDLEANGLRTLECLPAPGLGTGRYTTPWYYYVTQRA